MIRVLHRPDPHPWTTAISPRPFPVFAFVLLAARRVTIRRFNRYVAVNALRQELSHQLHVYRVDVCALNASNLSVAGQSNRDACPAHVNYCSSCSPVTQRPVHVACTHSNDDDDETQCGKYERNNTAM